MSRPRSATPHLTTTIAMFDVPSAPPATKPEAPDTAQLLPVVPEPPAVLSDAVEPSADTALTSATERDLQSTGGACDLTGAVQAALQSSVPVRDGLLAIPRDERSVANAIMVWNVGWIAGDGLADTTALALIRDVVARTVAGASSDCRLQQQGGPRLLILPTPDENIVLAMGSGRWRWQDLLDTARPRSGDPAEALPAMGGNLDFDDASTASVVFR